MVDHAVSCEGRKMDGMVGLGKKAFSLLPLGNPLIAHIQDSMVHSTFHLFMLSKHAAK